MAKIRGTGTSEIPSLDLTTPLAVVDGGTGSSTIKPYQMVLGTPIATTSGTSHDFTGIPAWVKRITVVFNGISLSGTAHLLLQVGVGSTPTTSGYVSSSSYANISISQTGGIASTAGYVMWAGTATYAPSGHFVLTNISENIWICSGLIANSTATPYTGQAAGNGTLSSTLGMVRITTTNGTDTFDAGSVNIIYEGYED